MGRLIDIDVLFDYFGNDAIDKTTRSNIEYFVSENGTVQAIPKADYENRLKADMEAMLEELKSYIELMASLETNSDFARGEKSCVEIIQQKIDKLKED